MGFDSQLLLGGDNIPHTELGNQFFDRLVFVPCVVLLEFLNILHIQGCDDGFNRQQFDQLLEGALLPIDLLVLL